MLPVHFRQFNHFQRLFASNFHRGYVYHVRIRNFSSETNSEDTFKDNNNNKKVILERNFCLNPSYDNSFSVKTSFMNVRLKSTELESNSFRINVFRGDLDDDDRGEIVGNDLSRVGVRCHVDEEGKNVVVTGNGVESDPSSKDRFVLQLQVPVNSNLEIESDDITLAPMQLKKVKCHIRNEGVFRVHNLKCEDLDVNSDLGSVLLEGFVLGNVRVSLGGDGTVDAGLSQGTVVKFKTEKGSVRIKALYCDESEILSNGGTVQIENLTGRKNTICVQKADANIVCLDGSIDLCVNKGNANVYVSRTHLNQESTIRSNEGNVNVSFSESIEAWVRFEGRQLQIQDEIEGETITNPSKFSMVFKGMLNKGKFTSGPTITASAPNGTVTAKILDWFHRITMGS